MNSQETLKKVIIQTLVDKVYSKFTPEVFCSPSFDVYVAFFSHKNRNYEIVENTLEELLVKVKTWSPRGIQIGNYTI